MRSWSTQPGYTSATPSPTCAPRSTRRRSWSRSRTGPDDTRKLLAAGADVVFDSLDEFPPWLATMCELRPDLSRPGPMEESRGPRQRDGGPGRSSGEGEFVDDFDAEFDSLWSRAYGVAYVVLGDRGESEDIAQETLARGVARWRKVSEYAEPWVVRVAGNLAIDRVPEGSDNAASRPPTLPAPTGSASTSNACWWRSRPSNVRSWCSAIWSTCPRPRSHKRSDAQWARSRPTRSAWARRASQVDGGCAVSGFDFDVLRDPDVPIPGTRQREQVVALRARSCALVHVSIGRQPRRPRSSR